MSEQSLPAAADEVPLEVPSEWKVERAAKAEHWYQESSVEYATSYRRSKEDAIQREIDFKKDLESKAMIADALRAFGLQHATLSSQLTQTLSKTLTMPSTGLKMPHFTPLRHLSVLSCPFVDSLSTPLPSISFHDKLLSRAIVSSLLTSASLSTLGGDTNGTDLIFFDELQAQAASSKTARLEAIQRSPVLLLLLNATYGDAVDFSNPEMELIIDRLTGLEPDSIPHVIVLRFTPPPTSEALEEAAKLRRKKKSAIIDLSNPSPAPQFPFDPSSLPIGHPMLTEEGQKKLKIIDLDFSIQDLPPADPDGNIAIPTIPSATEMALKALDALRGPLEECGILLSPSSSNLHFHPKQAIASLLTPPQPNLNATDQDPSLTTTTTVSSLSFMTSSLSPSMVPSASPMDPGASWAASMQLPNPLCLLKPIDEWSIHDVQIWLQSMGKSISRYAPRFLALGIDGISLVCITDSILKDFCGIADKRARSHITEALRTVQRGTAWIPSQASKRPPSPLPSELITMTPSALDLILFDTFRYYDRDDSQSLCLSELTELLAASELQVSTEAQVRRVLADYDDDKDGKLNAQEAMAMLHDLWRVLVATNDALTWGKRGGNTSSSNLPSGGVNQGEDEGLPLLSIHTLSSPRVRGLLPNHFHSAGGQGNGIEPTPPSPFGGLFGIPTSTLPLISSPKGHLAHQGSFTGSKSQASGQMTPGGLSESFPLILPAGMVAGKVASASLGGAARGKGEGGGGPGGGGGGVVFVEGSIHRPKGRHGKLARELGPSQSWKEGGGGGDVWRSEGGGRLPARSSKSELQPWSGAKSTVGSVMPWSGAKSTVGSVMPWSGAKSTVGSVMPWSGAKSTVGSAMPWSGAKSTIGSKPHPNPAQHWEESKDSSVLPLTGSTLRALESNPDLQPKSNYFSPSSASRDKKKGGGGSKATRFGDETKSSSTTLLAAATSMEQTSEGAAPSVATESRRKPPPPLLGAPMDRLVFNEAAAPEVKFEMFGVDDDVDGEGEGGRLDLVRGNSAMSSTVFGGGGGGGEGGSKGDSFNRRGPRSHVSFIGDDEERPVFTFDDKKGGARSLGGALGLAPLKVAGGSSDAGSKARVLATVQATGGGGGGGAKRGIHLPSGAASLVGTQAALAELDVFFESSPGGGAGLRGPTDPQELSNALTQVLKLADLRRAGCLDSESIRAALSFAMPAGILSPYEMWMLSSLGSGGVGSSNVEIAPFVSNCIGAVTQWQSDTLRRVYGPGGGVGGRPTTAASFASMGNRGVSVSLGGSSPANGAPLTFAKMLWRLYVQLRPLPPGCKANEEGEIVGPEDKEVSLGAPLSNAEAGQLLGILSERAAAGTLSSGGGALGATGKNQGHPKIPFLVVAAINQEANGAVAQSKGSVGSEVNVWSFHAAHALHVYLSLKGQ